MAIPYPSSPSVGDTFTYGGIIYTWSGTAWISVANNTTGQVGSVFVTAPITNTGTPTAPVIGINQGALSISASQVSGTAVTLSSPQLVPSGGTAGQVLSKVDATDYNLTWSTPSAGGSFTGGTLTSGLVLGTGTSVYPLTFQSGLATGTAAGAYEYDGVVYYATPNATSGKALNVASFYYVSDSDWLPDFSISSSMKSMLGASTQGITLLAGTSHEYEFYTTVKHEYVSATGIIGSFDIGKTTVSGSPTTTVTHQVDYGSNTTGFTTATTLSTVRPTASVAFSAAISSGSRYSFLRAKGVIRVTGSGSVKIYPGLSTSATSGDNIWTVQSGTVFRLTPIGNGTVTKVGGFA